MAKLFVVGNKCETLDCECHQYRHAVSEDTPTPPVHSECDCYFVEMAREDAEMIDVDPFGE